MHDHRPLSYRDQEIPVVEHNTYKYLGTEIGPINRNAGGGDWNRLDKFLKLLD